MKKNGTENQREPDESTCCVKCPAGFQEDQWNPCRCLKVSFPDNMLGCDRISNFSEEYCMGLTLLAEAKTDQRRISCGNERSACHDAYVLRDVAERLFTLNLLDLVVEFLSLPGGIVAFVVGVYMKKSGDLEKKWRRFLKLFVVFGTVLFIADLVLQFVAIIVTLGGADDAAAQLQEEQCFNSEGVSICTEIRESVRNIRILGITELLITLLGVAIESSLLWSLYKQRPPTWLQLIGCLSLVFIQCLATSLDFFLFTVDLNDKQRRLFESLALQDDLQFCAVKIDRHTIASCIENLSSSHVLRIPFAILLMCTFCNFL